MGEKSSGTWWMVVGWLGACSPVVELADATDAGLGEATAGEGATAGAGMNGGGTSGAEGGSAGAGPSAGGPAGGSANAGGSGTGAEPGACDDVVDGRHRRALESYCSDNDCPETLEEARALAIGSCAFTDPKLFSGCGIEAVRFDGGYSGLGYVFDADSGELVGAYEFTDTNDECLAFGTYAGVEPRCDEATVCSLCDESMPRPGFPRSAPTCRDDCRCDEIEPLADPCFGPETCECYCSRIELEAG